MEANAKIRIILADDNRIIWHNAIVISNLLMQLISAFTE